MVKSARDSVGSSSLQDQLRYLLLEEERFAEIALQNVARPDDELRQHGLIQAQSLTDHSDLLRVGIVPGDDGGRIGRR